MVTAQLTGIQMMRDKIITVPTMLLLMNCTEIEMKSNTMANSLPLETQCTSVCLLETQCTSVCLLEITEHLAKSTDYRALKLFIR